MSALQTLARGLVGSSVYTLSARGHTVARRFWHKKAKADEVKAEFAEFNIARPYKLHRLETGPKITTKASNNELLDFFSKMAYYRRVELVSDTLYKQRAIRGFCHLYDGQEAVLMGMQAALRPTDSVITAYRDHCHQIARGGSSVGMIAELIGTSAGCSKGKGGSMHLYHSSGFFYGGNGIVGAQVPLGAGLAFKHYYTKDEGVCVAMYGDGAANQGQIAEAANIAALLKLPLILVCENNQYAMGTSCARGAASTSYYTRGDYIPGLWVDGMDVLASRDAFAFAADHCRAGKGPIVLEMSTYRYHGHSMSDPGVSYRTREEIAQVREEKDCIDLVRKRLLKNKWATEEQLKAIEKSVRVEVDKDVAAAKAAGAPAAEVLFEDVYTDGPSFVRGVEFSKSYFKQ